MSSVAIEKEPENDIGNTGEPNPAGLKVQDVPPGQSDLAKEGAAGADGKGRPTKKKPSTTAAASKVGTAGRGAGKGGTGGDEDDEVAERVDRYGNPIIKINRAELESPTKTKKEKKEEKKKSFKVTFVDKVEKDQPLTRTHYVLSFKKYNAMNTFDPMDTEQSQTSSHCCTIF